MPASPAANLRSSRVVAPPAFPRLSGDEETETQRLPLLPRNVATLVWRDGTLPGPLAARRPRQSHKAATIVSLAAPQQRGSAVLPRISPPARRWRRGGEDMLLLHSPLVGGRGATVETTM